MRAFRMGEFKKGSFVVDVGGGPHNVQIEYLKSIGVECRVYDPYNRSNEYNKETIEIARQHGGADYVVASNVLNTIRERHIRIHIMENMKLFGKPDALFYFTFYSGDSSGVPKLTPRGWQNNWRPSMYFSEIQEVFPILIKKDRFYIAKNEIQAS